MIQQHKKHLNRFHTAYRLPSESIRDFAQRLKKLFHKAFPRNQPNAPDRQADYQLRIRFIAGLDPRLQRYVRSANPNTLQLAIVFIKKKNVMSAVVVKFGNVVFVKERLKNDLVNENQTQNFQQR